MEKIKEKLKSVRVKLFITLACVIMLIIAFLIFFNNVVFSQFFIFSKTRALEEVFDKVDNYYNNLSNIDIQNELEKIAIKNNFDILIKDDQNVNVYTSNKDFFSTLGQMNEM